MRAEGVLRAVPRVRAVLPHGSALPESVWATRRLVVAKAAFELGNEAAGRKALDATPTRAKRLVSDLLGQDETPFAPGSLVREEAAAVKHL